MSGPHRAAPCAAWLLAAAVATAHAGQACEPQAPRALAVERAMTLAVRTAQRLDTSGAQVVVLARAGQDLSAYGLRYSHLGFAYRDPATRRWRVLHKLNHCGSATAALYRQGLGEFFLDDLHEYQAAVLPLRADVQARLLPLLQDNARAATLHTARYSMVAYPWAQRYQQSNQWAIETLALAAEPQAATRERAQAWLRLQGYAPSTLRVSAMQRLGARMGSAHIAFDDHPDSQRYRGRIDTVTADSVLDWLARSGLGQPVQVVR